MEEKNTNSKQTNLKQTFFQKVWYSIFKLEKYGEMSAEGLGRAITYLLKLSTIVAIIISFGTIYQINGVVNKGITFVETQVGEFTYKDGILTLEKEEPIRAPSSIFGEVIIDTKIETPEEINSYLNSMKNNRGVLILKDKALLKRISTRGVVSYEYKTMLKDIKITDMNKQQLIDYVNGSSLWTIYLIIFAIVLLYSLVNTFLPILFNALLLSIFGFISTFAAKIRIRYVAIFNLAAYSLTLSIFLHALYIIVNIFTKYNITYFQLLYISLAAIYIIASIFMIKSDFLNRQVQAVKTVKVNGKEDKEDDDEKNEDKDDSKDQAKEKNEHKDTGKSKNKDKSKDGNNDKNDKGNDEPEGSQA